MSWQSYQTYSDGELEWEVDTLIAIVEGQEPISIPVNSLPEFDARRWVHLPARFKSVTVDWIMEHAQRILSADLYYPIIMTPEGEVADGMHRLAKARWIGLSEIKAVILPDNYRDFAKGAK